MQLGAWGESVAARYLKRHGWRILARNYRFQRREIDLVALRDGVVAFVEVKTRSSERFGDGAEAVTPGKQRAIAAVASAWIEEHPEVDTSGYRFDLITITPSTPGRCRLRHLEDAWRLEPDPAHPLPGEVIFGFSF